MPTDPTDETTNGASDSTPSEGTENADSAHDAGSPTEGSGNPIEGGTGGDDPVDASNNEPPVNDSPIDEGSSPTGSDPSEGATDGGAPDGATNGQANGDSSGSVFPLPSWKSFALIGAGMLIVLIVVSQGAKYYFEYQAGGLTKPFELTPPAPPNNPERTSDVARRLPQECSIVRDDPVVQAQILRQRAQAVELGDAHRKAAITFGSSFFANVAILGVFGLISLLSVAVIAKTGLDKANGHVIAIFLLSAGIGLTYQNFFGVFQPKQNIDTNLGQEVRYANLVYQIDAFCATGQVVTSDPKQYLESLAKVQLASTNNQGAISESGSGETGQQPSPSPTPFFATVSGPAFVSYTDHHLEALRRFAVSFDDKLVPSLTDTKRLSFDGL